MVHDFELKSHVFELEEIFEEIQKFKSTAIGFVVLANQVKENILPKH